MSAASDHAASLDDWRDRGVLKPFVAQRRVGGSLGVHMVQVDQPAGAFRFLGLSDLLVASTLSAATATVDVGPGPFQATFLAGDLIVGVPDAVPSAMFENACTLRGFVLPRHLVEETLPGWKEGPPFGRLHEGPIRDSMIASLFERIWRAGGTTRPVDRRIVDTLAPAALALLAQLESGPAGRSFVALRQSQLAEIEAYVDERLGEDISLNELAALVALSPYHFARAFRHLTGEPPQAWLRRRRIERAKTLLRDSQLDLVEVALAVGYGSQSAFGVVFRRLTGRTPKQWRASGGAIRYEIQKVRDA